LLLVPRIVLKPAGRAPPAALIMQSGPSNNLEYL
jgi:hypothetical protein